MEYAHKSATLNDTQAIRIMFDAYRVGMYGLSKNDQYAAYWAEKGVLLEDAVCQKGMI